MNKLIIMLILFLNWLSLKSQILDSIELDKLEYSDECISCFHSFNNTIIDSILNQHPDFSGNLKSILIFDIHGKISDFKILIDNCNGCSQTFKNIILDSAMIFECKFHTDNDFQCIIPMDLHFNTPSNIQADTTFLFKKNKLKISK